MELKAKEDGDEDGERGERWVGERGNPATTSQLAELRGLEWVGKPQRMEGSRGGRGVAYKGMEAMGKGGSKWE